MRVMSAGDGYKYLMSSVITGDVDRDPGTPLTRYYTESGNQPGTWMGSGLAALTAEGRGLPVGATVTEEQLARLLGQGMNPVTGDPLGRPCPAYPTVQERIDTRTHQLDAGMDAAGRAQAVQQIEADERARTVRKPVAGFDFTFSPPKSVSALWAVADGATQQAIVHAHHAAVADVLALMEERVAFTRTGHGGTARMETTGLLAAGFDHHDSRTGDPQLHTHLVVSNKVQGVDGKWRSLDSRLLHRATVALSETYDAFLADHITAATGLTWTREVRGADRRPRWELAGVPARLREVFSTRTLGRPATEGDGDTVVGIAERADALIAEYRQKHGRTPSRRVVTRLRQQATLETRPAKEKRTLAEQMKAWRATAQAVLGQDATEWATALLGEAAHATPDEVHGEDRADRVASTAAEVVAAVGDARASWTAWNLWAEAARQTRGLAFATTAERTAFLTSVVQHAQGDSVRLTPAYDRLTPTDMILPDEHIATSGRAVDVLVGAAGTGKTTTLATLRAAWEAEHGEGSVIGLAPSAAAADVLATDLGVSTDNTARFLTLIDHGRATVLPGQLVIVDEASLAGTLTLDRLATLTEQAGAKLLLVGDWAQLTAVDAGGAFALLAKEHPGVELLETHRFAQDWEKAATLRLRTGDLDVAETYAEQERLHAGVLDEMIDAAYTAWRADQTAGLGSVLIVPTNDLAATLNTRARTDLVDAGIVTGLAIPLRDGTTAGRGDRIITWENNSDIRDGFGRVKNRDTWMVVRAHRDGALTVRRTKTDGGMYGKTLRLPAAYVAEQVTLGYAITTHQAQGITTDTAHALLPEEMTREGAYVALTRGREANHAYLPTDTPTADPVDDDHLGVEPVTDPAALLTRILAKVGAEQAATLTLRAEQEAHTSVGTLWAEYETLATQATQTHYHAVLQKVAPEMAEQITADPGYPALTRTLRTLHGVGYDTNALVGALTHAFQPGTEHPARALQRGVIRAVKSGRVGRGRARLAAGLVPAAPTTNIEYRDALTQRARLIHEAATADLRRAYTERAAWLPAGGRLPTDPDAARVVLAALQVVAVYRAKHSISGDVPLGPAPAEEAVEQVQEYASARAAYAHALRAVDSATDDADVERSALRRGDVGLSR